MEEYTLAFNNLSVRVGLNKTNEKMTSCYLVGLNQSIRDELEVIHVFNLRMLDYILMSENTGVALR